LSETELKQLCDMVKLIMTEESNVQPVHSPVTVVGDLHGQFFDLIELFKAGGPIPGTRYIFMGDYVDRGQHSVETIQLLLCYKALYPYAVTLIRGNHECRQVTHVYGFYDECIKKYGTSHVWRYCCEVFDYMPLGALIDGTILCVHGGLSPDLPTLDSIRLLERVQEIPSSGALCDLMWSDPEELGKDQSFKVSERGAGFLFGEKATKEFLYLNDLQLICRSHQLVMEGYQYKFKDKNLITVWSAPNYTYRCGNKAAILAFNEYLDRDIILFKESAASGDPITVSQVPEYFL